MKEYKTVIIMQRKKIIIIIVIKSKEEGTNVCAYIFELQGVSFHLKYDA